MPKPTPSPSAPPPSNVLPFDSTLLFVLDDPISSKSSKGGQIVRAHLKNAIVVGGRSIAAAGTPAQIRIVDASPSDIADTYGFVDIFFEPLALSDGRILPLRTPVARLSPNVTSGHESTVSAEDTVGDIFVPYYPLWQIMRKGKNFVLGPGSVIPANTEATLTAQPQRRNRDRHAATPAGQHRTSQRDLPGDAAGDAVWPRRGAAAPPDASANSVALAVTVIIASRLAAML